MSYRWNGIDTIEELQRLQGVHAPSKVAVKPLATRERERFDAMLRARGECPNAVGNDEYCGQKLGHAGACS